jgi:tRNA (cmo5U34)-methyltransferase
MDSKISLEIATEVAKRMVPNALDLLDVGSVAGNYTLMMLSKMPNLNCTLLDLSKPMLDKAVERVSKQARGKVTTMQSDIRSASLRENHFDTILSGAVLHHLRDNKDWETTFSALCKCLRVGCPR